MGLNVKYSEHPPRYKEIVAAFPEATKRGVIFTFGDTVYVPDGETLTPSLKSHEAVHVTRQVKMGADLWWDKYLVDPQFRLDEELPAHRAEYYAFKSITHDRAQVSQHLNLIAGRLAGPLYGGLVTLAGARRLIMK